MLRVYIWIFLSRLIRLVILILRGVAASHQDSDFVVHLMLSMVQLKSIALLAGIYTNVQC